MIDLLVINFNTRDKLQRLLDTLNSDYDPDVWRLFVQDNGSEDGSKEFLSAAMNNKTHHILYYVSHANVGYARAANDLAVLSGDFAGGGDILAVLNADVWMTTADVAKMQEIMDKDPTIAICGPKQRDEAGNITHAGIIGTNVAPKHRGWHQPDPEDLLYRDQIDCVTVAGSAYFVRRSVWNDLTNCETYKQSAPNAVGAFLPTELYYEETFCSYHAKAHNYRVVYTGEVSVGHSWHASSTVGSQTPKFERSRVIFRQACDLHGIAHD